MDNRFKLFTVLITKINRYIKKIKTREMAEFNLKSTHLSCLYYLHGENSLTAKDLCDICDEDKAAISRSLNYLESNGFLKCHSKSAKKYKCPLELTEKGKQIAQKINEKISKILDKVGLGLSHENRLIFYETLKLICGNLKTISGN